MQHNYLDTSVRKRLSEEEVLEWGKQFNFHPPHYIFHRVLESISGLAILQEERQELRLRDLYSVSFFLVDFESTTFRRWRSLWLPKRVKLGTLEDIEKRFEKMPLVGLPTRKSKSFLEYDLPIGYYQQKLAYEGEPDKRVVCDRLKIELKS